MTARAAPEDPPGAGRGDDEAPEYSRGTPLDEPQPSTRRRRRRARGTARRRAERAVNRAALEALLEGVPLPATKRDLVSYAQAAGDHGAVAALQALPGGRFSTLDEVGEALRPVQPAWPRERRVPRAQSDLPTGGPSYGR